MSEAFERRSDLWTPGQVITIRNITRSGRIWDATPVRVVEDSAQLTVLYKANGTIYKRPKGIDEIDPDPRAHSAVDLHRAGGWTWWDVEWKNRWFLILVRPDDHYAVYLFYSADPEGLLSYYVNFQKPFKRRPSAIDTQDYAVDLIIRPDLSWFYKDEKEFLALIEEGVLLPEMNDVVYRSGQDILDKLPEPSWFMEWTGWRPPPDWEVPELAADWDSL